MDLDDLLTIPRDSVVEVSYTSDGREYLDLFYFIIVTGDRAVILAKNRIDDSYGQRVEFLVSELDDVRVLGSSYDKA